MAIDREICDREILQKIKATLSAIEIVNLLLKLVLQSDLLSLDRIRLTATL